MRRTASWRIVAGFAGKAREQGEDAVTETEGLLLDAAARICSETFGTHVELAPPEDVRGWDGRTWTRRCRIAGSRGDLPASVIVKQFRLGDGHGMAEWAGLEFVNRLALDPPVVPRFYGGDVDLGLIVIEDLGDVGTRGLSAILRGADPEPAADALVAACATLGRLHAAAHGREREYRELRAHLPDASHEAFHQIYRTEGAVGRFITNVRQAGIAPSPGVQGELDSISARLADSGSFLTFTHGDVCLSNIVRVQDGIRMFDLEVSGFRHALLDGAFVTMRSLGCQESGIIPAPVQRRMRDAYRRELAAAVPEARDDDQYNSELVALSAVWLALLLDRLPAALEKDRKMVLGANRQRILHALDIFTRLAGEHACFPAIARTARDLHARLRDLWPGDEHQLALFPAFI